MYISKDLVTSTHVFVCHDAVHKPLQSPYDGPYRVLKHADKFCALEVTNCYGVVLLDHLKPAFKECDFISDADELAPATNTAHPSSIPSTVTHIGLQVHRHVRFS